MFKTNEAFGDGFVWEKVEVLLGRNKRRSSSIIYKDKQTEEKMNF
jgi:hypothetical protein